MGVFRKQGVWWVDYYVDGHRKRERIGPDKRLAETVLKKRKVEIAEGKYLDKQRPVTTTVDELAERYFTYARDQQRKRSWPRDRTSIKALTGYFGGRRVADITPADIEQYRAWRYATRSRRGRPLTPATVNRELACLKRMFSVAMKGLIVLKGGLPRANPAAAVSLARELSERDRVLTPDEFCRVSQEAPAWLRPMLLIAYHTGMREGEVRSLRWEQIDLKRGTVRLKSSETKTDAPRTIPLNPTLTMLLKDATRYVGCPYVFINPAKLAAWHADPEGVDPRYRDSSLVHAFTRACHKAGVANATFHDLRHTFVTNARRAGIDYFRIMAITGHKTMTVFKRYNTIDERDVHQAMRQMDTYMDTNTRDAAAQVSQPLENT
jgi:integrase